MNFYYVYDASLSVCHVAATFGDVKDFVKREKRYDYTDLEVVLRDTPTDKENIECILQAVFLEDARDQVSFLVGPEIRKWCVTPRRGLKEITFGVGEAESAR